MWYDKKGIKITAEEACKLHSPDNKSYWIIGLDHVGGLRISTVWLAINHAFGNELPILFETMVFAGKSSSEVYCHRYSFEEDALAGHLKIVETLSKGIIPEGFYGDEETIRHLMNLHRGDDRVQMLITKLETESK